MDSRDSACRSTSRQSATVWRSHFFGLGFRQHARSKRYTADIMKPRNRQTHVAIVWTGIAVLGVFGAILPFALGIDGMGGGYAIAVVSGFVALCGLITAAVFGVRARILGRLLSGTGVLAYWTYPEGERADHTRKELAEERRGSWILFLIIAAFSLVIGVGFLIADPDAGRYVLLVLLGVVALLAVVATLAPRIRYAKRLHASGEAIVSLEAAYVLGILHTWRLLGARVEEAKIAEGPKPVLQVTYSAPALYGKFFYTRRSYTLSIPVPRGEEERARDVARALHGSDSGAS